jgi:hypothetical protein
MRHKSNFHYPIFLSVIFLSLSFPIQVLMRSPLPALIPYLFLGYAFLKSLANFSSINKLALCRTDFFILIFIALAFSNSLWQVSLGFITGEQFLSSIVISVLPFLYYLFFRYKLNSVYLKDFLWGIAVAGIVCGFFGVYDTFLKLNGLISDYSFEAHLYSIDRMGKAMADSNMTRISTSGRSMGLLEKHSISAAWVSFGCFAALALSSSKKYLRFIILATYGLMLIALFNTTAILAFFIAVLLFECNLYTIFLGFLKKKSINAVISFVILLVGVIAVIGSFSSETFFERSLEVLAVQMEIVAGTSDVAYQGVGYFAALSDAAVKFFNELVERPNIFFFGQGFSFSYGGEVGGDFGIVDSLYLLGFPLAVCLLMGLFILLAVNIQRANRLNRLSLSSMLQEHKFALSIILYVILCDVHYSIWYSKSIFAIFLVSLSIFLVHKKQNRRSTRAHYLTIEDCVAKN